LTRWTVAVPVLGAIIFAVTWGYQPPTAVLVMVGLLLAGCVFAAVHHAEVVAHRVGEPFGALILAVAVTVIEVGLIVMLMVSGGPDTSTLARDTVFAAVMITCNGLALLVGSLQPGVASFKPEGTAPALATVATLATLTLVLPTFTTSTPGPEYSAEQLGFASVASLALYLLFVFVQTVRDRGDFLPAETDILMVRSRRGHPQVARRWQAWACWSWDWSRWWGWPRSNHRRSRAPSRR
jgi:Ca2+:H+ antiporter